MPKVKLLITLLIFISAVSLIWVFKASSQENDYVCLEKSYQIYKNNFMSKDGRIIDYERAEITTSEGEAYMLLRSLVMNDKKTFDLVWKWTKNNLQRDDKLFSWLWGKNGAQYGIIDPNSASDADVDIAFALITAYKQFKDKTYLDESIPIVNAIWDKEVKREGNYLILMPGVKQATQYPIEINPSYFSPYAFKTFHVYDDLHDWLLLVDSSYDILFKAGNATKTGLFPDWCLLENNKIVLETFNRSDFSYDAIRVFARVYLDYLNTKDERALKVLGHSKFFVEKWQKENILHTIYNADGQINGNYEFTGGISILLSAISTFNPEFASLIYKNKLVPILENNTYWSGKNDYYGKNITWFGIYLYQNNLGKCERNTQKASK